MLKWEAYKTAYFYYTDKKFESDGAKIVHLCDSIYTCMTKYESYV